MNQNLDDIISSISKNPQMLSKALEMAKGLAGQGVLQDLLSDDEKKQDSAKEEPDNTPALLQDVEPGSSHGATMQQKIDLLCAIKPFLSPERQKSLDSILHILKLAGPLLSASKLLK